MAISISETIFEYIFSGSLKKAGTWGGIVCANYVPYNLFVFESVIWVVITILLYYLVDVSNTIKHISNSHINNIRYVKSNVFFSLLDKLFAIISLGMWLQVLYYKINLKSLVNLLQPCHLSILWQGIALCTDHPISSLLSLITLPMTIGAVGALAVPATEGLDQPFEEISFFIQHYVLLITPLYLLIRNNFNLLKIATFKALLFSNWTVVVIHWIFFNAFDRYYQVNVNFFLCPSEGLAITFSTLPQWMVYPSYRTFLAITAFLASSLLWYIYIGSAYVLYYISRVFKHSKQV